MKQQSNKAVAIWLTIGAVMIIIQVLLGGITRLTGSGLSITEWKPILGALPPLNEHDWMTAFEKYKQIAQYKYIHNYFTLSDFKNIYFWEWLHRNWARFMGVVFIVPFIYFIYSRKIKRYMLWPMVILFLLGALQGLVGWVMVSSGVGTNLVYVSPVRLAVHFIAALVLLVYVIWFILKITVVHSEKLYSPRIRRLSIILLALLTLQLIYGAFMAGTHAAEAAITWPTINGKIIPNNLSEGPHLQNLVAIQFVHRSLAYIVAAFIIFYTVQLYRQPKNSALYKARAWPLAITILQITLGVLTLAHYIDGHKVLFGVLHQLVGILLLVSVVITYFFSCGIKKASF